MAKQTDEKPTTMPQSPSGAKDRPSRAPGARRAKRAKPAPPLLAEALRRRDDVVLGSGLAETKGPRLGFHAELDPSPAPAPGAPVKLTGEGHLLTFAPTGCGKGRSAIIPTLLEYEGSAIVLDPKGEAAAVTARRRREMGQDVRIIDPFGLVTEKTDSLNPFDVFSLPKIDFGAEAESLAALIAGNQQSTKEPFWDIWGRALTAGVIAAVAGTESDGNRNFAKVRDYLKNSDPVYGLAALLDRHESKMHRLARQEIGSFLQLADITRSGVIATAQSYLSTIASDGAAATLMRSSVDLNALREGAPMTIYLVIPPTKLASHSSLLRLWVSALMTAVMSRTALPALRTLFLIDECGQLGRFDLLPSAVTLARGYGMRVWAFFQDLSQLKNMAPNDWQAVATSAAVLQIFGVANHFSAVQFSEVIGDLSAEEIRRLPNDQQVVMFARGGAQRLRLPDYLMDGEYAGSFDPNPIFANRPGPERPKGAG